MRSVILVIFSALGLAGLFIAYWVVQPATPVSAGSGKNRVVPPPPKNVDTAGAIRPGEHAWLHKFDGGTLSSEFTGEQYHPRPNGTIDVTNPIARFYLANQQRLEISGKRGNVVVRDMPTAGKTGFVNSTFSPPSKGRLDDVTVRLFDDRRLPDTRPALTMTTNNAVFDNETFIIYTEGYKDADGHDVAADQVPVRITGDIEMKGRGLKVRWNDTDGRLELLEIAHGQILIVKPSAMRDNPKNKAQNPQARLMGPIPVMLAGRDPKSAGEVITSYRPPATQPKSGKSRSTSTITGPVTYRASFFDNVRINQLDPSGSFDQLLIDNADRMDVDFLFKQSAEKPATRPANKAPAPATAPKQADIQAADSSIDETAPDSPAKPQKDPEQPVYIRWTGLLRITPIASAPFVPLKPGDYAIKLAGAPVQIHRVEPKQQGAEETRSATVLYASAGENVWLDVSPQVPQTTIDKMPDASLADQRVTHLVSLGRVQYAGTQHLARMTGPGNADVPLAPEPGAPPAQLHAAWGKLAEFDFSALDAQGQPAVKAGHFQGDVDINHPRLNLRSQSLDLQFATTSKPAVAAPKSQKNPAKPQSQTNLESVVATTGVNCELLDADGKKKNIDADRLTLETAMADGRLYPRHVLATGSTAAPVHAYAEADDLTADSLDVLLRPATPVAGATKSAKQAKTADSETASVELQELVATGHVIAKSKDASTAIGDRMVVNGGKNSLHTILTSAQNAKVISAKGDLVTGPRIEFNEADGRAYIVGAGMLYSLHQESTTQPAEPIKVTWTTGAQFDGAVNRIDADGSIVAESTDRRGFVNKATGDHVRIDLRNKAPSTQPVLASARVPKASTTRSSSIAGDVKMDLFKDKEVVAMTLDRNAEMNSTLPGPGGSILQQMVLDGRRIVVQQLAPDGSKCTTVTVPAAGKMLVRDYRTSQNDPQGQGTTAFAWQKSFVFNDVEHRADMDGSVQIKHLENQSRKVTAPAAPDLSTEVDMSAEHVTAWFEPPPAKPVVAAGAKSGAKANSENSQIQLKKVTALSSPDTFVIVTRGNDAMRARQIDYDPKTHKLIATGSPRNPVTFVSSGTVTASAESMEWDTITWKPSLNHVILNAAPATPAVQSPKPKPKPQPYRPGQRSNP